MVNLKTDLFESDLNDILDIDGGALTIDIDNLINKYSNSICSISENVGLQILEFDDGSKFNFEDSVYGFRLKFYI
jgi:hypothetical protein